MAQAVLLPQEPGKILDDYLVSLRDLVKTCKFCSTDCTEKNLCDQIMEGLLDGDIPETLLMEKSLRRLKMQSSRNC